MYPAPYSALEPDRYFDHSATTPVCAEAIAAMSAAWTEHWGNPSSLHRWGQRATLAIEQARLQVAELIGAIPEQLIFTSGGTEAANLAILGVAGCHAMPQHLVISAVEHAAVRQAATYLQKQGWHVTQVPVNRAGYVQLADLKAAIQTNTVLVSIIHGQSEIGTVQDIASLSAYCHSVGVLFHTDAVQTVGRLALNLKEPALAGVDLLSCASHKLYGPQGVGALYSRVPLAPQVVGGSQEAGLRAGTQAVAMIAGFGAAAVRAHTNLTTDQQHVRRLQQTLAASLAEGAALELTGETNLDQRLPHHLSYVVRGYVGNRLVQHLSQHGFAISSGSACSSGTLTASPVLTALGYDPETAWGAIRLSCGRANTPESAQALAEAIKQYISAA